MAVPPLDIQKSLPAAGLYSDSRTHGYQGPTRNVRLPKVSSNGGGAISKSEDGVRCAVTGKECRFPLLIPCNARLIASIPALRIVRVSDPSQPHSQDHKSSVGRGNHRIDCSRNFWDGSGLKIDSTSTDVAWGHGRTIPSCFCRI